MIVELEHQPSGLGWLPDGSLLFVSQEDHRVYKRTVEGEITLHADVSEHCAGDLNDMVVDSRGRAFVGEFGFNPFEGGPPKSANPIRVDPDGFHELVASDLLFPNGSVITGDDRTLIVGEGFAGKYTAFTIADDGSLSDRRDWAVLSRPADMALPVGEFLEQLDVIVDGCRMDAEGAIWAADVRNAKCLRVLPGGEIAEEIAAPQGQNIFACMLGGEDGKTLLLCVAPGLRDNDRLGGWQRPCKPRGSTSRMPRSRDRLSRRRMTDRAWWRRRRPCGRARWSSVRPSRRPTSSSWSYPDLQPAVSRVGLRRSHRVRSAAKRTPEDLHP